MADEQTKNLTDITELPPALAAWAQQHAQGGEASAPAHLDSMLVGTEYDGVRESLRTKGYASYREKDGSERFLAADFAPDGRVISMAAAIPRNPGKSYDFLNQIDDFRDALTGTAQSRKDALALFHKLARADGTTNNAINKLAALIAPEGDFKVRGIKGQRGKAQDAVKKEAEFLLNWWKENVNARGEDSVISGDRGVTAFILQGSRLQFIEGDHIARHIWPTKKTTVPGVGKPYTLPMNLQTYSAQHIEIPEGLAGTDTEIMYWAPPATFIQLLQDPKDANLKKHLDKIVPSKVKSELIKNKKFFLDPSLLIHIKHRGTQVDTFGQSLIEPTMTEIRYKRALDALELTVITNLIARAVIIKVGSDKPDSVYHKQEVSAPRLALLQRMMRNVGPSATILWAGPDIDVVEVSAHDALLDIVPRFQMAERRHLMALGLPAVLMVGEGTDGKAAGFAAALGVAAQLQEIQYQYAQALRSLAERILLENGFEEVDVVWEWRDNVLEDKQAAAELILKTFQMGLLSTQTATEELGFDYGAEEIRQAEDVSKGYKDDAFGPPKAAITTNPSGDAQNAPNNGRPSQKEKPAKDPRTNKETKSPVENK